MDLNKLTMKSQAALQEAQQQATVRHHQLIEPEHVLFALLADAEGVVFPLLHHVGANPAKLRATVDEALDAMPKVYAQGVEVRISPATAKLLEAAGTEAEALTDEYISTEHLLLAILATTGSAPHSCGANPPTQRRWHEPFVVQTTKRAVNRVWIALPSTPVDARC